MRRRMKALISDERAVPSQSRSTLMNTLQRRTRVWPCVVIASLLAGAAWADGELDTSFGSNGAVRVTFPNSSRGFLYDAAVVNGVIEAAGFERVENAVGCTTPFPKLFILQLSLAGIVSGVLHSQQPGRNCVARAMTQAEAETAGVDYPNSSRRTILTKSHGFCFATQHRGVDRSMRRLATCSAIPSINAPTDCELSVPRILKSLDRPTKARARREIGRWQQSAHRESRRLAHGPRAQSPRGCLDSHRLRR